MFRSRLRRVGWGFESLERREVLSGNVSVSVAMYPFDYAGTLRINGDGGNNTIAVWSGPNPWQVIVAGGVDAAGQPTLVNGQQGPVAINGVTKVVAVNLGNGNDRILFTKLNLQGSAAHNVFVNPGDQ